MTITCTTCHRQDTIDPADLDAIIMGGWYADETGTYCETDMPDPMIHADEIRIGDR